MKKHRKGLILVFTGDGKGKSTAALGLALRAAGHNLRVLIIQFMKGFRNIGEIHALNHCHLSIEMKQCGRPGFVQSRACEPLDKYLAGSGITYFQQSIKGQNYDLIILDEILVAVDFGLIEIEKLCSVLDKKPPDLHVVLTGRNAPLQITEKADLVTEMRNNKHPFEKGIRAQMGIEY